MTRADGKEITQLFPYVYWEMAIDGATKSLANKKSTNNADDIEKAMTSMFI
jgi:hypothetical protein